jgi:outer membrane murein-binding lipoprotein Lpp
MVQILRDINIYATSGASGFNLLSATLEGAKVVLQTIVVLGADVAYVFKQTGVEIGGMAAQLAALMRMDFSGFNAISKAMKEDAARARAELDAFQKRVLSSGLGANAPQASYSNEGRNYAPRPKAIVFSPVVPRVPASSRASASASSTARETRTDALGDFIRGDQVQGAIKRSEEMARAAARAIDQTRTPLERLNTEQEDLLRLKELGYLQDEDYLRAARASVEAYEKTVAKVKTENTEAIDQAKRLGDAFSSTFDNAFRQGQSFGDLLKKLAYDAINIQFLTPAAQKVGSSLGGIVSKLFSFDGGGYTGSGARSGGVDGKGGFMAVMHPNETVLDHTRGQGVGGGAMYFSYSIDARGADAGVEQRLTAALRASEQRTRAAIPGIVKADIARGGSMAKAVGRA